VNNCNATKKETDIMKAGLGGSHNVAAKNGKTPAIYTAGVTGRMSLENLKSWMMGGTLY
jgi:hypothetical protein